MVRAKGVTEKYMWRYTNDETLTAEFRRDTKKNAKENELNITQVSVGIPA